MFEIVFYNIILDTISIDTTSGYSYNFIINTIERNRNDDMDF